MEQKNTCLVETVKNRSIIGGVIKLAYKPGDLSAYHKAPSSRGIPAKGKS